MDFSYEKLFTVHVEHKYFANTLFTAHKIFPTKESQSLFLKYGLILKSQGDGFSILFASSFEGTKRNRESLLKENITLQFTFEIADPSFYEYTGNLPGTLAKRIFWFSNFDEKQKVWRKSHLLHSSEFVSESELKSSPDRLNYFGQIEIQFNIYLKEDLYIRFLNKSSYWRYIIVNEHLQKFEKLTILDKANQKLFSRPEILELSNGKKGIAFTSTKLIALTQQNIKHFKLVDDYDEITNHFEKVLISELPVPSLSGGQQFNEIIIYL